jgi:hypothetical protein
MAAANAHHRTALGLSLGPLGVSALATEEGDIGKNKDRHRDDHVDGVRSRMDQARSGVCLEAGETPGRAGPPASTTSTLQDQKDTGDGRPS